MSLALGILGLGGLCIASGGVSYCIDSYRNRGAKKLEYVLERCNIKTGEFKPKLLSFKKNEIGTEYTFTIPLGMSIKDFKAKEAELQQALRRDIQIKLVNGCATIQTIEKSFKDTYKLDLSTYRSNGMKFKLGRDRTEQEVLLDLTGNDTHTLVVGATGSGKSVAINVLIVQMIIGGIELALIDLKAVEFCLYQNYKKLKGFAIDEDGAFKVLQETLQEMNNRYQLLLEHKKKNYKDFNKAYPNKAIKPRLLVIDEFQSLIDDKASKKLLFMLLTKARAANIIIVLSCQSPRHEIVDGRLRDNIKNYLIFKCETPTGSAVATGEQGNDIACKLKGNGRGLLKAQGQYTEFQGYYLNDNEIERAIKPYNAKYEPLERFDGTGCKVIPIEHKKSVEVKLEASRAMQIDLDKLEAL